MMRLHLLDIMLEGDPQAEFNLPEGERDGGSDLTEIALRKIIVRVGEMRSVGRVVSLDAELGLNGLCKLEILEKGHIDI